MSTPESCESNIDARKRLCARVIIIAISVYITIRHIFSFSAMDDTAGGNSIILYTKFGKHAGDIG